MADNIISETQEIITPVVNGNKDSQIFGVSVRGWMAVLCISTVCICSVIKIDVSELLGYLATGITAFYFGQNPKKP